MYRYTGILGYSLIFLISLSASIYAEDVCVKKGPCTCEFLNGTGIDLTPSANFTFYTTTQYKNSTPHLILSTYFFHPCNDVKPVVPPVNTFDTCDVALQLCRNKIKLSFNGTTSLFVNDTINEYLGNTTKSSFSSDGRYLLYDNDPSFTQVMLVCSNKTNQLSVYNEDDDRKVILAFFSKDACLKQITEPGRSTGSTLLIIFFSCVIFYLVLGVCTKKFLMGATGIEVIPNLAFWSDLPNLVKDGWVFALSGFKLPARGPGPAASPDPNSYDSI